MKYYFIIPVLLVVTLAFACKPSNKIAEEEGKNGKVEEPKEPQWTDAKREKGRQGCLELLSQESGIDSKAICDCFVESVEKKFKVYEVDNIGMDEIAPVLAKCGEENDFTTWPVIFEGQFDENCRNAIKNEKSMDPDKVCPCFIDHLKKNYPTFSDIANNYYKIGEPVEECK